MIILIVAALAVPALAQHRQRGAGRYSSDGCYFLLGGTVGPSFSNFFDHLNNTYPTSKMKNFGGNVSFALGYISDFIAISQSMPAFRSTALNPKAYFMIRGDLARGELIARSITRPQFLPAQFRFISNSAPLSRWCRMSGWDYRSFRCVSMIISTAMPCVIPARRLAAISRPAWGSS